MVGKIDAEGFRQWVREGNGDRSVKIVIGQFRDPDYVSIWVYDFGLGVGQFVTKVDEIDLQAELKERLAATLRKAQELGLSLSA